MLNQVMSQFLSGRPQATAKSPAFAQAQNTQALQGIRGIETQLPSSGKRNNNPFMAALSQDRQEFQEQYGINRPLAKPMFLGYRDNQALYGGARLFILY